MPLPRGQRGLSLPDQPPRKQHRIFLSSATTLIIYMCIGLYRIRNPWRSNDQDGSRQFVYNRQPGVRLLLLLRCSRGFENVDDVVLDGLPPSYQECKSAFLLESDHVVILIAHLNRFSPILKMQPCRKLKCERTNPSKELEGNYIF